MNISASCSCGNKDVKKFKYYDGALGYEALICKVCLRYSDHNGEHKADNFLGQLSREFYK